MDNGMENKIMEPQFEELTEKEAKEFKKLLSKFMKSYSKKEEDVSDKDWLKQQFKEELPNITEEEAEKIAIETIDSIKEYDDNLQSINESAKRGVSKEQWMADHIIKASSGVSVIQFGEYLNSVDTALKKANEQMMDMITTQASNNTLVSNNMNLDGFIAEQYHVNTFNANAALQKSKFIAKVKVPAPGEAYGKNSIDVVILDTTNPKAVPVHRYQMKYGANAQKTIDYLREYGDVTKYPNQQIVVPPDQVEAVQKAFPGKTVVSKIGGTDKVSVSSNELTKEQAKELQLNAQENGQIPTTDWNTFKTKDLALQIGKNAGMAGLQAAAITTGFSLASQVINGEGIDTDTTVEVALTTGVDAGVKAATAGALKVAAEKGVIRLIPKGTPAGIIANIACVGIENIKILSKVAIGEMTMSQAMEQMGRTTTSMIYGIGWGAAGATIGVAALSWIPIVGPVVGGLVGGMVGHMAGSKFGEAVYSGLKAVGNGVKNIFKSGLNKIKSVGRKIKGKLFG